MRISESVTPGAFTVTLVPVSPDAFAVVVALEPPSFFELPHAPASSTRLPATANVATMFRRT